MKRKRILSTVLPLFLMSTTAFMSTGIYSAQEIFAEESAEQNAIYLNGASGDDSKDGTTKETAVKTFAKAKELATNNSAITTIYVTGTVPVSGEITLEGTNAVLKREKDFNRYLLSTSGETTFKNITIDGNQENSSAIQSLVNVSNTLNIQDGTVLQNNKLTDLGYFHAIGGAIYSSGGTINMTGGTIKNNTANFGGGVYLSYSSEFNLSGGSIENNYAINGTKSGQYGYAAGGGVCVYDGSTLNLTRSAIIKDNYSEEMGGGISIGTGVASNGSNRLNMAGGTITNNSAGSGGGGIFVQAGMTNKQGVANISAGEITNNAMTAKGSGNNAFGGGGIYVNGYPNVYTGFQNGEVHLTNALITENSAVLQGGGYAGCPSSETHIFLNDGAAFYGNTANGGNEIYILASNAYGTHSGNPEYTIANTMLGAVPYNWKYDDGTEVDLSKLDGKLLATEGESLSLHTDSTGNADTLARAKVKITGNTSNTRGAGIGSNGTIYIGTEEKTSVSVEKKWNDNNNPDRPSEIQIGIYRSGTNETDTYIGYQTVKPDADGNWETVFNNLLKYDLAGNEYSYTLKENKVNGYTSEIEGSQENGYTLTNSSATSISVKKVWVGKAGSSATIHLYADGKDTGKSIVLTKDNNWTYTFENLNKYNDGKEISYTVTEDQISGYSTTVSGDVENGFVVTNTEEQVPNKPTEPNNTENSTPLKENKVTTPKTGDDVNLYLYFSVLAISVTGTIIALIFKHKNKFIK